MNTITIPVDKWRALSLLKASLTNAEKEDQCWQLVAATKQPDKAIDLEVWVDGCDTPHKLTLYSDGTYAVTTVVEV